MCPHPVQRGHPLCHSVPPLLSFFFSPILSSCLLQTSRVFSDLNKKFSATCSYNWSDRLSVTLTWLVIRLSCRSAQPGHNTTNVNFHQSFFLAIGLLVTRHWLRTDAQSNDVLGWLFFLRVRSSFRLWMCQQANYACLMHFKWLKTSIAVNNRRPPK